MIEKSAMVKAAGVSLKNALGEASKEQQENIKIAQENLAATVTKKLQPQKYKTAAWRNLIKEINSLIDLASQE